MTENTETTAMIEVKSSQPLSAVQIKAYVQRIQEVMKTVMQNGVHYGKVPGCGDKPTLLKPGAEKLLSTFKIACDPRPTDLSTNDEIRYRIEAHCTAMYDGAYLGSGIGECSSNEEKYKWRRAICDEEFNETPEDRKREKWAVNYQTKKPYRIKQIRTNMSDLANTILKMAKKRALVDAALTLTAASDIFTQDIEDLPDEMRNQTPDRPPPIQHPQRKSISSGNGDTISDAQRKRLYAIYKNAGFTDEQAKDYLIRDWDIEHSADIKRKDYDAICAYFQNGGGLGEQGGAQ